MPNSTSVVGLPAKVNTLTSLFLLSGDPEKKRGDIRQYFLSAYARYEDLFSCLTNEAFYQRANPLRHPLIFYYAHTAVFYWNKLLLAGIATSEIDPEMETLMAIGVDEMSWDDLNISEQRWPSVNKVKTYREKIKTAVLTIIDTLPISLPISWQSPWWAIMMGIEHDYIHLETSSVLIRQLPLQYVKTSSNWAVSTIDLPTEKNQFIPVSAATVTIGRGELSHYYGWDNEYGHLTTHVNAFAASQCLVSNHEYLEFVEDAGYSNKQYWSEEGWAWVSFSQDKMPSFWLKTSDGRYQLRCMLEMINMPWSWPVVVNALEAEAFCLWKSQQLGKQVSLPTEAQYKRLQDSISQQEDFWCQAAANIALKQAASEMPVTYFQQGNFYDVIGNVWQWTQTPVDGLPGFKTHPLYDDYSTPTFDGKHSIIKGGSWISIGNEAGYYARYAFRRHFHQHSGFRYVSND